MAGEYLTATSTITGTAEDPVLVIWMWASGANFEAKLNQYENDPTFSPQLSISAIGPSGVTRTNGTIARARTVTNAVTDTSVDPALASVINEISNSVSPFAL